MAVLNASPGKQPPKVVDVVTAVESALDKAESFIPGSSQRQLSKAVDQMVASTAPVQKADIPMATTAPAVPKVSWLKKVGQVIGKILGIVAKDAKPVADTITQVVSVLYPGFAVLAQAGDALVSKIALEATAVESVAAQAGTATGSGVQKLEQVLGEVGPVIDQWVANAFPGSKTLTATTKAGLISAVVAILNEVEGTAPTA